MARIIKPAWHRWGRFVVPLVATVTLIAVFAVPAHAVHDIGVFELDTGAGGANAVNQAAPGDDWDNVCYQVAIDAGATATAAQAKCTASTGTTGSTAVSWTAEMNQNSSIFSGGGSKDPSDISQWAYKNDAGGLPDKDNLEHAFAARYNPTVSDGSCGKAADNTTDLTSCDVIYFGSDRFDNSGDAQQGFWFLQNQIDTGATKSGGGFGFTCTSTSCSSGAFHKNGDLLIVSDFSNGGTTSTITVYKWDTSCTKTTGTCGDTNLRRLATSNNALCGGQAHDPFCGITNFTTTDLPWDFTDKSGTPSNGALTGELFEAGINLSSPQINLGGECFATVVSETRSSTSTTAVLKDFVLGSFGKCESGVATSQNWLPNDSATVTVTGTNSWGGTVDFTLYDGPDCGVKNADGTAGPTVLYQEDTDSGTAGVQGITVGNGTTFPVKTTNTTVFVPTATGLTTDANGAYSVSWKVTFTPDSTSSGKGVKASSRCEATTGIAINDDVSHT